ncbi:MAG: PSD1 domain-containing protein [Planctomycetia bacterium]|nr:PSD1 domain-containing protein [Planctomycetia bacterium]
MIRKLLFALALLYAAGWGSLASEQTVEAGPDALDYNRDIRQILSNNCYACHGPDKAKLEAGLRLDHQETALAELESGGRAIVPGDSSQSQLIVRITSSDEDEVMPPKAAGKSLKPEEIEKLRRWIDQGAKWKGHWSYLKVERPALPAVSNPGWPKTPIDHFILHRLDQEGLRPSPEADRAELIRRLNFDLTGLPPAIAEVDAFVADQSPTAYEKLVDRLLSSPRYGERMAQKWLDLARYADTNGYHIDNHRDMWRYREWVINAFNRNLPFDQFTTEQIAGDLLPGSTLDQKIASGFHRNVMVNFEGGADPAEYLTKYIVDRVTTTATVWLGTTLACTECHDHKYDPFTQREFYQLYAYFNNVPEQGLDGQKENPVPSIRVPSPEQTAQLEDLRRKLTGVEDRVNSELAKVTVEPPAIPPTLSTEPREYVWVDDVIPEGTTESGPDKTDSWHWVESPRPVLNGKRASERTATGLGQSVFTGARLPLVIGDGDKLFAHVYLDPNNLPDQIMVQFNDGTWEHRAYWGASKIDWGMDNTASRLSLGPLPEAGRWVRLEVDAARVGLSPGTVVGGWACTQFGGHVFWDKLGIMTRTPQASSLYDRQETWELAERSRSKSPVPEAVQAAVKIEPAKRGDEQRRAARDYFVRYIYNKTRAVFDPLNREANKIAKAEADLEKTFSATMVMQELPQPRDTFVLVRGDFRSKGDKVAPGVPASLSPLPAGAPANRLGLAQWLVDPNNPLVSRVTVNRYWQQYFGTGLVKTSEDFGSQGEWPSHPELLDWLACEFVASGWNIKGLQKQIVMSATYRQSSHVTPESLKHDPYNRLMARGPRFRLDAEMIRDNALSVSGLLDDRLGGPSVSPYQPAGLWEEVGFGPSFTAQSYVQSHGVDLYRRGIYTYWKRALPYPPLVTFDAPNREVCTDARARTNTPLQALVLLNDPSYVEAARVLGQRILKEGGATTPERLAFAFRLCTARAPQPKELEILTWIFDTQSAKYKQNPAAATKLIGAGESPRPAEMDVSELAAWTALGNVLLNLDETITKG